MQAAGKRRLTLLDLIVLIAAAAPGLMMFPVISRAIDPSYLDRLVELFQTPPRGWNAAALVLRPMAILAILIPVVAPWTLAVLVLRLSNPRPSYRRMLRQPGVVACLAAVVGMTWAGFGLAVSMLASSQFRPFYRPSRPGLITWMSKFFLDEAFPPVGLAVAAAWLTLSIAGRWRRTVDWVDGFGRLLGVYWIVLGLCWLPRAYLELL